jgi:hypothetical protein
VATQPALEEFRPTKLYVPPSRPESAKGFPFECEMGRRMVHELGSYAKVYGDLMTQIST